MWSFIKKVCPTGFHIGTELLIQKLIFNGRLRHFNPWRRVNIGNMIYALTLQTQMDKKNHIIFSQETNITLLALFRVEIHIKPENLVFQRKLTSLNRSRRVDSVYMNCLDTTESNASKIFTKTPFRKKYYTYGDLKCTKWTSFSGKFAKSLGLN